MASPTPQSGSPARGVGNPGSRNLSQGSEESSARSSAGQTGNGDTPDRQPAGDGGAGVGDPGTPPESDGPLREALPGDAMPQHDVVVVEEGVLSARVRRPLDVLRMLVGLLLCAVLLGFVWLASDTSADLDQRLLSAIKGLPDLLVLLLDTIAALGLLALPVAVGIDLLIRGRRRQLFDAFVGLLVATTLLSVLSLIVGQWAPTWLHVALSGSDSTNDAPFLPLFGGLVAFITVARTLARPHWSTIAVVVVVSLMLVTFLGGGLTVVGILMSLLIGWISGLAVRYALGTPTTRPSGRQVAQTLIRAGFGVVRLEAESSTEFGRRYVASTFGGDGLHVVVLDRDLEGAGLASAAWRSLRLRTSPAEANVNMRRTLEQRALLSYAAQVNGVPAPRLLLTSEVGPDSALLAYEWLPGERFASLRPEQVSDADVRGAFATLALLQRAHLAHRALSSANLLRLPDGRVAVTGIGGGAVAASDVSMRIDTAELLATTGTFVGPRRAVAAATEVLGIDGSSRALPVLQAVAMSPETRRGLRDHKGLLNQLRDTLIEQRPDATVEQIQVERLRPRTLITIVLGTVAGYVLLSQLASVDLVGLVRNADWRWAVTALLLSAFTYVAAAWALIGFVPERLRLIPTIGAQLAASFATLITPPTLGAIAINLRYLQRQGLHPALATASIGASQAAAFAMHILLLLFAAVAAGTQSNLDFQPPRVVVVAVAAAAVVSLGLLAIPAVRRRITGRVGPLLRQVGPRLLSVVQQPRKLLEGVGGLILLNIAYVAALASCVYAFGGHLNITAIAVVYLTGSVVGQAAPTPGGLGAVEAALAAGLTAAGLASGVAVSAVLLFRLVTFWIPTVPGWFSFNAMQRRSLL